MAQVRTPEITSSLRNTRQNIGDVVGNGIDCQLDGRLRNAGRDCGVIKLDNEILSANKSWRNKCDEGEIQTDRLYVMDTTNKSKGYFGNLKTTLSSDTQAPNSEEWAYYNATEMKKELNPLKDQSENRLNNFCDYIGVTDRYRGYKQNFANPGTSSVTRQEKTGKCCSYVNSRVPQRFNLRYPNPPTTISPYISDSIGKSAQQQQCQILSTGGANGADTNEEEDDGWVTDEDDYPGITEYIDEYRRPPLDGLGKFVMSPEGDEEYTFSGLDRHAEQPPLDNSEYTDMYATFKERPDRLNVSRTKATDNIISDE